MSIRLGLQTMEVMDTLDSVESPSDRSLKWDHLSKTVLQLYMTWRAIFRLTSFPNCRTRRKVMLQCAITSLQKTVLMEEPLFTKLQLAEPTDFTKLLSKKSRKSINSLLKTWLICNLMWKISIYHRLFPTFWKHSIR